MQIEIRELIIKGNCPHKLVLDEVNQVFRLDLDDDTPVYMGELREVDVRLAQLHEYHLFDQVQHKHYIIN